MADETPLQLLMRMINGYQISQAIHTAAELGIADQLAGGPRTAANIATAVGSDPAATYRLMRALAAVGVFEERAGRVFSLTPVGGSLRSDSPTSVRDWAIWIGQESFWNTWGKLTIGIRTGQNVFPQVYGESVWEYRAERPELSAIFDRAMSAITRADVSEILKAYDFSGFAVITDIAGGNGALLARILLANPSARGILFDQPHVITSKTLEAAGVGDRCEIVGGSFFEGVPEGADAYILKHIVHDWSDEDTVKILGVCRQAMKNSARLLLIERVVGPPNQDPVAKFSDLNMLVNPGGRERTEEEYATLLKSAGLRLTQVVTTGSRRESIIEAVPA